MSRKVFISSDISLDEALADIADANPMAALMWPWLLLSLDDWGRGSASSRRLKAQLFPMNKGITEKHIQGALEAFDQRGLIQLYEADGEALMAVAPDKWFRYQTHIRSDKRDNDGSRYPAPPARDYAQTREISAKDTLLFSSLHHTTPHHTSLMSGRPDVAREVFDYWREKMGHTQARFSDDRRRKIDARLKDGFTVDQLKRAIDGCAGSPHHRGENDTGTVYDSIELIFRNAEKTEWFAALPGTAPQDHSEREKRLTQLRALPSESREFFCRQHGWGELWKEVANG